MRIGMDCLILGGQPGGVPGSIESLALALAGQVELICYVSRNYSGPLEGAAGLTLRRLSVAAGGRAARILCQQSQMPAALRRDRVEVLHASCYTAPINVKMPLVLTVHDLIALTHPRACRWQNVLHFRALLPSSIRRARVISVPSAYVKNDLLSILGVAPGRVEVVPHGVDARFGRAAKPSAALRRRYSLPEKYLLWVGRLEARKGLQNLLEAIACLSLEGVEVPPLVLAGPDDGFSDRLLRRQRALAGAAAPLLTGAVPAADLPHIYAGAEAFIFPSLTEGFGIPPLEAMACGVPVIASDGGALPEVTGGAALLFRAGDSASLALCLGQLLASQELRTRLSQAGRERAAGFTWKAAAAATANIYRGIAESCRCPEGCIKEGEV